MRGFPVGPMRSVCAALGCYFKMALTGQTAVGRRSGDQVTPAFANAGWSRSRMKASNISCDSQTSTTRVPPPSIGPSMCRIWPAAAQCPGDGAGDRRPQGALCLRLFRLHQCHVLWQGLACQEHGEHLRRGPTSRTDANRHARQVLAAARHGRVQGRELARAQKVCARQRDRPAGVVGQHKRDRQGRGCDGQCARLVTG
jgi:hypothetical protein